MGRFTEKMVILCTPEQKEAARRMAGGKQHVSQFMRFLMMNMAQLQNDKGAAEAFAEEFAEGIHAAMRKMVREEIAGQVKPKKR